MGLTFSFFAFLDASLIACLGAFCFLLFFWNLEAIFSRLEHTTTPVALERQANLLFRQFLHEVIFRRYETEQRLKRRIVLLQRSLQHACVGRHPVSPVSGRNEVLCGGGGPWMDSG